MTNCFKRVALKFAVSVALLLDSDSFAQAPGDERWDIRFSLPGTDNSVLSMIVKGPTYTSAAISRCRPDQAIASHGCDDLGQPGEREIAPMYRSVPFTIIERTELSVPGKLKRISTAHLRALEQTNPSRAAKRPTPRISEQPA